MLQIQHENISCRQAVTDRSSKHISNAQQVVNMQNSVIQFGNTPSAVTPVTKRPVIAPAALGPERAVRDEIDSLIRTGIDSGKIREGMIYISVTGYTQCTYSLIRSYLAGNLVLYRAASQMLFNFPQDSAYLEIHPKGPKVPDTDPRPDFAGNDTNWTPFTSDIQVAYAAMGFGKELVRRYLSSGAIDPDKPLYIIQQITVKPPIPIAFAMDGEVQIKGVLRADRLHSQYSLDDVYPGVRDLKIREMLGIEGTVPSFKQAEYDKIHRPGYERPEFLK